MASVTTRCRPTWDEIPPEVRAAVEQRLGARVTGWISHDGGLSPGLASTLRTDDGAVFVKAVPVSHRYSARANRQEAARMRALPAGVPAPRAHWLEEIDAHGGWVAVAFEAIDGRAPTTPLAGDDLDALARLAREIGSYQIASGELPELADPLPFSETSGLAADRPAGLATYDPWFVQNVERVADLEEPAPEAVRGNAVVHGDLRGDNAVLVGDGGGVRALAVDWAQAGRGCAFHDLCGLLPSVHAGGGPPPEDVLARHPLPPGTDDDAVDAWLAALTGYFVAQSLEPAPPGVPHLRGNPARERRGLHRLAAPPPALLIPARCRHPRCGHEICRSRAMIACRSHAHNGDRATRRRPR